MNNKINDNIEQEQKIQNSSIKGSQIGQSGRDLIQVFNSSRLIAMLASLIAVVGIIGIFFSQELEINTGLSEEERLRKIDQANQSLQSEILTNIKYIDNRLGFVASSLLDGDVDGDVDTLQEKINFLLKDSSSNSYRQLIAGHQVAELRQAFNGRPLRHEAGASLIKVLVDGDANSSKINEFYNEISEVHDASESLLRKMSDIGTNQSTDYQRAKFERRSLALAIAKLRNRSMIAYVKGINALDSLDPSFSGSQSILSALNFLKPTKFTSQLAIDNQLEALTEEAQMLTAVRAEMLKISESSLSEILTIQPSDTWNVVVGKAIALRKRGQISESITAFKRYGEMFTSSDPTAAQYSHTAQIFVRSSQDLNVEGGMYIYKILNGDIADKVGLQTGDIIIKYGGVYTATAASFIEAQRNSNIGKSVEISYLRLQDNGAFVQQSIEVNGGKDIGAELMPI